MLKKIYMIEKTDPATPAFCTFGKRYFTEKKEKDSILVELFKSKTVKFEECTWDHINIWGFKYKMKFKKAVVDIIWINNKEHYLRCIKPKITELMYDAIITKWQKVTYGWGNEGILDFKNNIVESKYYLIDTIFDNKEDMEKDIQNMSPLNYTQFCNEIFADG